MRVVLHHTRHRWGTNHVIPRPRTGREDAINSSAAGHEPGSCVTHWSVHQAICDRHMGQSDACAPRPPGLANGPLLHGAMNGRVVSGPAAVPGRNQPDGGRLTDLGPRNHRQTDIAPRNGPLARAVNGGRARCRRTIAVPVYMIRKIRKFRNFLLMYTGSPPMGRGRGRVPLTAVCVAHLTCLVRLRYRRSDEMKSQIALERNTPSKRCVVIWH